MSLSALCIRRPVMTILLMAMIVIAGIFGFKQLPVAAVPRVDFPTIQVQAQLPGASPETMAASVASILERQFSTIAGVTSMTSTSSLGNTAIVLQFDLNRSIDGAALDVQSAISSAMRRLPVELPTPPSFRKVNPADFPIMFLALKSSQVRLSDVDAFANRAILPRISTLPGIAQVLIFGTQKYAVRVRADLDQLAVARPHPAGAAERHRRRQFEQAGRRHRRFAPELDPRRHRPDQQGRRTTCRSS